MKYISRYCFSGEYFECSETQIPEEETIVEVDKIPAQELPLETDLYLSTNRPIVEPDAEEVYSQELPLSTEPYRKSSVRKITYRFVISK